MHVFFLDILLHPLTPLLVMIRRWCDRSGARRCRERWERGARMGCFRVGGLERKSILTEAREMMRMWVRNRPHLMSLY